MNYQDLLFDVTGWLGAASYLIPYFLLIRGKLKSTSMVYHVLNTMGSLFLILNTAYYGALPSAFTNSIWGGIAFYGMWRDRKNRQIHLATDK